MELQLFQQILDELKEVKSGQLKLESKIDKLEAKVTNIEAGQQEIRYDIRALKFGQEKLEADIANVQKDTSCTWQAVLELSQTDKGMQEKLQKHDATLDAISTKKLS